MPKYKPKGCKCGRSNAVNVIAANGSCNGTPPSPEPCFDVCTNPICGTPQYLTLLAPVVYDEIGINLCRQVTLAENFATTYPSAESATAEAVSVTFSTAPGEAPAITPISGRPNCYSVTLRSLTINFAVKLYDCAKRILAVLPVSASYLPASGTPDYTYFDEDTNPSSVELELYAPYGVSYSSADASAPVINYVGFLAGSSSPAQGLNMIVIPKVLSFDASTGEVSMGLTIYLKSIYYSQYLIPHNGRAVVPKGSLIPQEDSVCMEFVSGSLLDREIKPLELGPPHNEETLKNECENTGACCCPPAQTPPPAAGGGTVTGGGGTGGNTDATPPAPPAGNTDHDVEIEAESLPAPSESPDSLLNTLARLGSL
ncbi:MAG: hypothetical protein HFI66_07585 [Lachnospiraceae bacterium]|nr:hypothetical protein [Lachnospiraceae bacterium]